MPLTPAASRWRGVGSRSEYRTRYLNWHEIHELGKPMLPPKLLEIVTSDMRNLHNAILYVETNLAKDDNPTYPLYIGKVPEGLGFVDKYPGDLFFLRFNDIFDMFHMNALHPSMVRLAALSLAHQLIKENSGNEVHRRFLRGSSCQDHLSHALLS